MRDLRLRDMKYLETYGCYPRSAVIALQASEPFRAEGISFRVLRLVFDATQKAQRFLDIPGSSWQVDMRGDIHLDISFDLQPGYYLLLASQNNRRTALPILITDLTNPAEVAVIRPIFTQWSYHAKGFYSENRRSFARRMLDRSRRFGPGSRWVSEKIGKAAGRFGIQGIDDESGFFPAHSIVTLNGFYCRNRRWDRKIWDAEFGQLEGLWVDEVLSGMPIFAILDKHAIPYHVLTDVDLHDQKEMLKAYRVLIFSGQEGMTPSYYQMLERLQKSGMTSFLLWGVQAFGYRQLSYDAKTGELRYECTRGRKGLWGDLLEERQPDWEDEANLFGFHFPEPPSGDWRQKALFSRITVLPSHHPIVRSSNTSGKSYRYQVQDRQGNPRPGLTWAGGEVQRRVAPDAVVLAHLDEEEDLIGIGEYRNAVIFAPTYLPAFFAFQGQSHPEVESWFVAALRYLLGRSAPCGSA